MTRLPDLRSAAGGLDVHRHDRAHAHHLAIGRIDPFGVEGFCAVVEPSENFSWVVVRKFNPVRVAVDELDSDCEGHAPEASRTPRRLYWPRPEASPTWSRTPCGRDGDGERLQQARPGGLGVRGGRRRVCDLQAPARFLIGACFSALPNV